MSGLDISKPSSTKEGIVQKGEVKDQEIEVLRGGFTEWQAAYRDDPYVSSLSLQCQNPMDLSFGEKRIGRKVGSQSMAIWLLGRTAF